MEQNPLDTNRFSASQEIPHILWNPKVHYRIYKSPLPIPTLCRSIQFMSPNLTSWRSILILSSHLRLGLPNGIFPSGFSTKIPQATLLSPIRATCPAHLILLDLFTRITFGVKCIKSAVTKNYTRLRRSAQLRSTVSKLFPAVYEPLPRCRRTYSCSPGRNVPVMNFKHQPLNKRVTSKTNKNLSAVPYFLTCALGLPTIPHAQQWHFTECQATYSPFIYTIIFLCAVTKVIISQRSVKHSIQKGDILFLSTNS